MLLRHVDSSWLPLQRASTAKLLQFRLIQILGFASHRLLTHYLPLYFPEIERHYHASRSLWLLDFLQAFPTPATITSLDREQFVQTAWPIIGRKVAKRRLLEDIYHRAQCSIGLPVEKDSEAVAMFRVLLKEMRRLCKLRQELEQRAEGYLGDNDDFRRLKQIPGIGPILALTILAEAGDLRRFHHHQHRLRRAQIARRRHMTDEALLGHIRAVHAETRGAYGWPRIWRELGKRGLRVGKQRVQRLMQQQHQAAA